MHEAHTLLRQWMETAGMTVHIDAIGNLRGLYPGITPNAPRLLIASHLDTVPNAGAFDGILGVALGVPSSESSTASTFLSPSKSSASPKKKESASANPSSAASHSSASSTPKLSPVPTKTA